MLVKKIQKYIGIDDSFILKYTIGEGLIMDVWLAM